MDKTNAYIQSILSGKDNHGNDPMPQVHEDIFKLLFYLTVNVELPDCSSNPGVLSSLGAWLQNVIVVDTQYQLLALQTWSNIKSIHDIS